jgi:opacity protein-like surface antigen
MKRYFIAGVAAAALMLSAGVEAQAQNWSGPEVGVQGGYIFDDSSGTMRCNSNPCGAEVTDPAFHYSYSPDGFMGGGHAGYNWQFGHAVVGIEGDAEGGSVTGRVTDRFNDFSVHTNMDFDASVRGKLGWAFNRFQLYGTGGVAFGDVRTNYDAPIGTAIGGTDGIRTGWTAGAGLAYEMTPNWIGNVEYRYTDLGHKDFGNGIAAGGPYADSNQYNFSAVRIGISYRFAPPPPPPAPMMEPMPTAAPAAAPPPPPHTFLVFFDFDRYNLTGDARKTIEAAADNFKRHGDAQIQLAGYTDLSGTQAYNLRLSHRRADAVAGYLAQLGVPRNVMDVKWFGKEHPRVPTPDGVREPQNRRVEIMMP